MAEGDPRDAGVTKRGIFASFYDLAEGFEFICETVIF